MWRERLWWRLRPQAWLSLASLAAGISSTGIFHDLLAPIPSMHLSEVSSSPRPGISPQCLDSSSQLLHLPGALYPVQSMYGCSKDCWSSFHLGGHMSAASLSAFSVSPLTRQLPQCGNRTPASTPPPTEGRSSPTNTPVFPPVPSSYLVLPGSVCSFPVSSSCPLSACPPRTSESEGVFLTYLCREVCSLSPSSAILFPCHLFVHYCCGCHWKTTSGELLVYTRSHPARSSWSHWICIAIHEWF